MRLFLVFLLFLGVLGQARAVNLEEGILQKAEVKSTSTTLEYDFDFIVNVNQYNDIPNFQVRPIIASRKPQEKHEVLTYTVQISIVLPDDIVIGDNDGEIPQRDYDEINFSNDQISSGYWFTTPVISSGFMDNAKSACQNYDMCTIRFTFKKQTVNLDNYIIVVTENGIDDIWTPISINALIDNGDPQLAFNFPTSVPQNEEYITLRFYYETTDKDYDDLVLNIPRENLWYLDLSVQSKADNNFSRNFIAPDFEPNDWDDQVNQRSTSTNQIEVIKCKNCRVQLQLGFSNVQIDSCKNVSLSNKIYFLFYFTNPKTVKLDSTLTYQPYQLYETFKVKVDDFIQLNSKSSGAQKMDRNFNFIVHQLSKDYEKFNNQQKMLLYQERMLYQALYTNGELRSNVVYVSVFNKLSKFSLSSNALLQVQGFYDIPTFNLNSDIILQQEKLEYAYSFFYKAEAKSTRISFRKTKTQSVVYVKSCGKKKSGCKSMASEKDHDYLPELNTETQNQVMNTDEAVDASTYYAVYYDLKRSVQQQRTQVSFNQYLMDQRQGSIDQYDNKLIVNDKFVYIPLLPNWAYVAIFEGIGFIAVIILCIIQYYVAKLKLLKKLEVFYEKTKQQILKKYDQYKEQRQQKKQQFNQQNDGL